MENKILVKVYVPMLGESFDAFIPVNEYVWKANKLITKLIGDISNNALPIDRNYAFINSETGAIYENNMIIINTDIRNSSKLVLVEI